MTHDTGAADPEQPEYGVNPPRRPGEPRQALPGPPVAAVPFSPVRYWAPGVALALAVVVTTAFIYVLLSYGERFQALGLPLILGGPVTLGCVLGYGLAFRMVVRAYFAVTVLGTVVWCLVSFSVAGLLCAPILALLGAPGVAIGTTLGVVLRKKLKNTSFSQRRFLPGLLLAALTVLGTAMQSALLPPADEETVVTTAVVDAPIEAVWAARAFDDPSRMAPASPYSRLGLPSPRGNVGSLTEVGDRKACHIGSGILRLLVVESEPPTSLAFVVTEQSGFEDNNVALRRGRLSLRALGPDRTRVVLSTTYAPLLRDRLLWRPIERFIARELHGHVVREMRRAAKAQQVSASTTSRGQFQRTGSVSPAPRETTSVESPSSKRSPFQR